MRRSAFGELLDDPARLSHADRVDIARRLAGSLMASTDRGVRWLGAGLGLWLRDGGNLAAVLGLAPEKPGQRAAASIVRREECDGLLAQLANLLGPARAARVLQGAEPVPLQAAELVARLQELGAPRSRRSITRARRGT